MKIKFTNNTKNIFQAIILIIFLLMFLPACGGMNSILKPSKTSSLTIEVEIPDRGMAISELNKDAISVLGKTDLNKPIKYKYQKFQGNDVIVFKSTSTPSVSPSKIESAVNGYKASYLISHTDAELAKLKNKKISRVSVQGISISDAIELGIKKLIKDELESGKDINVLGDLNIVNVFSVKYLPKGVVIDFSIAFSVKKGGGLTKADKADFYAEVGVAEFYRYHNDKAANMARKGLGIYENCDKCYYLKGLLNYRNKVYDRAMYNFEKAYKFNGDILFYCQRLQSTYSKLYELIKESPQGKKHKAKIQTKAFALSAYIKRHFNADGTLYIKKTPPISSESLKFDLPIVKTETLKNGLVISELIKNDLPVFSMSISFNFGTVNNPKGKMGMIDTTLELLKDGVEGKNSAKIAKFIDENGLSLSTITSRDYSKLQCSSLTENSGKCVELLNLLVKKATFPNGEYKKYMKKRVEYYHASTANASYLANKLLYRLVFGKHNYGYYDATLKTLSNIKLEDIKSFYKDYFNPKNTYIIVAGKYDAKLIADIKSKFSDWPDGKLTEVVKNNRIKPIKEKRSLIYVIDRPNSKQVVIKYGQSVYPYSSAKFFPLYMGNKVLGASASSRLFMRLREKESLTYGVYSSMSASLESGLFQVSLSVRNDVVGQAVGALLDELSKFKSKGVTKQELADKKGLTYGSFAMKLQGFGYTSMLIALKYLGLPADYYKNYLSNLNKLNIESVNAIVKEAITPQNGILVIVGDSKAFVNQLKPFARVVVLDENLKMKK